MRWVGLVFGWELGASGGEYGLLGKLRLDIGTPFQNYLEGVGRSSPHSSLQFEGTNGINYYAKQNLWCGGALSLS